MWAKFSPSEMERRWLMARNLMRQHDLIGLLVFGNSGVNRHNQANIFWLTNHLDLHHSYLIAPLDESIQPALYTGLANHVPNARQVSEVPIVEWGGYNPAETITRRLEATGMVHGRLGLVGVNYKFGIGMPYQHYQHLRDTLPDLELADVTAQFIPLRTIKSDEEVNWLRKAAEFTDQAIYALRKQVRPGMPEYALIGIIEAAYLSEGGLPHISFLRSMPMDAPNGCLPAQNPSDRIIQKGDVIINEISASKWGYSGQVHRPIFVGADPSPQWQHMFDTAKIAFERIASAIRPGAGERDVIEAASVIGEQGYAIYDDLIHGYGVDIHPPLIDRSCCQYWPVNPQNPPPVGRRFEKNMAIVIQPNPITTDERMGLQLGALTVVTETGAKSLHQVPLEPIIVEV